MRYITAAVLFFLGTVCAQQPPGLSLKTRIDLANVNGRIDHFSADVKGRRIFVSALGNHTVEVLDVASGKRLRSLAGLAEPQGVYYDPSTNHLFVACAGDGATRLYDAATFQLLETVRFSSDADNIRYDARSHRVLVGYGEGALGFISSSGKRTGDIALDAHPESFRLEKNGARVFVNVPDQKEIEVADLATSRVVAKWPVTSALRNFPMALDEPHQRLLIGCRAPARLLAIDTATGHATASAEIVGDTDDLFYDAAKSRVYVIGGQGFVDVFAQENPDRYDRIAHIPTAPGARTGLFVPEWAKLFVAVPHRGPQRAQILVFETN